MAWKDAFQYVRGIAGRHGLGAEQREDQGLPLGGRIGGMIKMQMTPFIHASTSGSLMEIPDEKHNLIQAVSRVNLDMSGSLYRYYLEKGDEDQESYLQLYQDEHGQVSELMYCTRIARIIPTTAEDQEAYLGEAGYGLGDKSYTLWREQLTDLGYDAAYLQDAFGGQDQLVYTRDAGDPHADFVTPFRGHETRIDDALGEHGLKQEIVFMPYVRSVAGMSEYLLITTEIVESQDGDYSKRGIHVDFMIGIPLEQDRVIIQ